MCWMMPLTQWVETRAMSRRWLQSWHAAHYQVRVAKEVQPLALAQGAKVLCVGCGMLPMTAYCLARLGFRVTAVDSDKRACRLASAWLAKQGLPVTVVQAQGDQCGAAGYQLLHLAAQVQPQAGVAEQLWHGMDAQAWLLVRLPKPWLQQAYQSMPVHRDASGVWCQQKQTAQSRWPCRLDSDAEAGAWA